MPWENPVAFQDWRSVKEGLYQAGGWQANIVVTVA